MNSNRGAQLQIFAPRSGLVMTTFIDSALNVSHPPPPPPPYMRKDQRTPDSASACSHKKVATSVYQRPKANKLHSQMVVSRGEFIRRCTAVWSRCRITRSADRAGLVYCWQVRDSPTVFIANRLQTVNKPCCYRPRTFIFALFWAINNALLSIYCVRPSSPCITTG